MPDIIVKQQPASNLTIQSNSTQLLIKQAAANNITVSTGSSSYVLPVATNSTLGGIIVGSNLTIANGVLSATSSGGGVTAFNNRTGNVSLTANDVTAVANGIYQANGSYLNDLNTIVPTSYGNDTLRGMRKASDGAVSNFVAGPLQSGTFGMVGMVFGNEVSGVEFNLGDVFATTRIIQYKHTLLIADDGISVETGTANWTWSTNHVLTQGRGDSRYQPVGSYLTSANLTWSNITGKPTFATVATSGSYTDLANTPNLSLYYLASNPTGYITASCLTYSNITGTPDLTVYLTTANAAATYLPAANFTYANIGGTIPTATNTTLGAVKVGSNLTIANGVLSATSSGGFQNGDTLNGGTY